MEITKTVVRPLNEIVREIRNDWKKVNYGAVPYLNAMGCLNSIKDSYGVEDGKTQVLYFLSNATSWRGDTARRIKAELNKMIK